MSYCSNCSSESNSKVCTRCGVKQGKVRQFCTSCAAQIHPQATICGNCGVYVKKPGILKFLNIPRVIFAIVFVFFSAMGLIATGDFTGVNPISHILSCAAMLLTGLILLIAPAVVLKKANGITKGVVRTNIILIIALIILGIVLFGVIGSVQDKLNEEKAIMLEQQGLEAEKAKAEEIIANVTVLFNERNYAEIVSLYEENEGIITKNENFAAVKDYFGYAKVMNAMDDQYHDYFIFNNVIETLEGIAPGFEDRDNLLAQLKAELQSVNGMYYCNYIFYIVDNGHVAYTAGSSVSDINADTVIYSFYLGKGNKDPHYCFVDDYASSSKCYSKNDNVLMGAFPMSDKSLLIATHEYCPETRAQTLRNFNGSYDFVRSDIPEAFRYSAD